MSSAAVSLQLTDLAVTYRTSRGELPAVGPLDLTVAPGEFVALIGPSGCGKSTLLKVVAGLLPPSRGHLAFLPEGRRRRGDTGFVFQSPTLLPWRTVRDNVLVPARILGLDAKQAERAADRLLEQVSLTEFARHYPHELSGGMRQRVSIARSLVAGPDILLMDEPFSALDPLIRNRLQDELLQLQEKMHCTIVFVSHDLEEAVKLGTTITIMEGGRIVQTGTPDDIVLRPANGYVADFVAHLNPLSVLTAADAMVADAGPGDPARAVAPGSALKDALPLFAGSDAPVWVVEDGAVRGRISAQAICAMLARSSAAA